MILGAGSTRLGGGARHETMADRRLSGEEGGTWWRGEQTISRFQVPSCLYRVKCRVLRVRRWGRASGCSSGLQVCSVWWGVRLGVLLALRDMRQARTSTWGMGQRLVLGSCADSRGGSPCCRSQGTGCSRTLLPFAGSTSMSASCKAREGLPWHFPPIVKHGSLNLSCPLRAARSCLLPGQCPSHSASPQRSSCSRTPASRSLPRCWVEGAG